MLEKCFFKKESFKSVFRNGYWGAVLNVRQQSIPECGVATEKDLTILKKITTQTKFAWYSWTTLYRHPF